MRIDVRSERRLWLAGAIGVSLSAALFLVCKSSFRRMPFESETWKRLARAKRYGIFWSKLPPADIRRAAMTDNLMLRRLWLGMTKNEVVSLLGEEDAGGNTGPWEWESYYDLVHEPNLSQRMALWVRWRTDEPMLELGFDRGKLVHMNIVRPNG